MSSSVEIVAVSQRAEQREFLQLPWKLYAQDPNWIPPLRTNQKELVGFSKHPFHDRATTQAFLARRNGRATGRVLAIVDHAHNDHYDERMGFFGFLEMENDSEVADGLLRAARDWLREQGMTHIRGPVNPSMNYECGLLIEGFDTPPTFMMTYNPDFYPGLIEAHGFTKAQDLLAFWGHVNMLDSLDQKIRFISEEAKTRFNVKLRRLDPKRFREDINSFLDIYNKSMGNNWGFVPMSQGELEHSAASLKHLIVPSLTSIAEVEGSPVAVVFGLLDYNPRIKKADGRLFPTGFLRLLWKRRNIHACRIIAANVLPEYQRWGLGLVVLHDMMPEAIEWGIQEAEFSWVLESNALSRGSLERGGAKLKKRYRIYEMAL